MVLPRQWSNSPPTIHTLVHYMTVQCTHCMWPKAEVSNRPGYLTCNTQLQNATKYGGPKGGLPFIWTFWFTDVSVLVCYWTFGVLVHFWCLVHFKCCSAFILYKCTFWAILLFCEFVHFKWVCSMSTKNKFQTDEWNRHQTWAPDMSTRHEHWTQAQEKEPEMSTGYEHLTRADFKCGSDEENCHGATLTAAAVLLTFYVVLL